MARRSWRVYRRLGSWPVLGLAMLAAGCKSGSISTPYPVPTPLVALTLKAQASPLCSAAFSTRTRPPAMARVPGPIMILEQDDKSQVDTSTPPTSDDWFPYYDGTGTTEALLAKHPEEVQALLCVQETQVKVGSYTKTQAPAVRRDWDVRLLSWPSGMVLAGSQFRGDDPPSERTVSSTSTCQACPVLGYSPLVGLHDWLAQTIATPTATP